MAVLDSDTAPEVQRPPAPRVRLTARQRLSRWDVKVSPYLYISPFFLLFFLVGLFPLVYTVYVSLFEWDLLKGQGAFVGLDNYRWVLDSPVFTKSLVNTISIFLLSSVPQVIVAVCVAGLLDNHLRGKSWWRMSVLLPFVVAPAAVALIFGNFFADGGVVNEMLALVGIDPVGWHQDRLSSHIAIATMVNWRWTGYNTLIFLAAMQAVPRDVYESAELDGAGRVRQFVSVTLPMIRPTMIFVIITSTIGGLQIFAEPRLFDDITATHQGGPDNQWTTITQLIYDFGWTKRHLDRASATAVILFLIIIAFVVVNLLITRRLAKGGSK